VVVAADDWDARVSDAQLWLGGREDGVRGRAGLEAALGAEFLCVAERELAYVTREHERKFALTLTQATVWQRRAE